MNSFQHILNRYTSHIREDKNFSICLPCFRLGFKEWENLKVEFQKIAPNYSFSWGKKAGVLYATFNDSKQNSSTL